MMLIARIARYLLPVACALGLPAVLVAQSANLSATAPAPLLNDQQRKGEGVFRHYCPLCHLPEKKVNKDPNEKGVARASSLAGTFRRERIDESAVRALIQQGMPGRMPGFRYTLGPRDMDDLIAYLKTR